MALDSRKLPSLLMDYWKQVLPWMAEETIAEFLQPYPKSYCIDCLEFLPGIIKTGLPAIQFSGTLADHKIRGHIVVSNLEDARRMVPDIVLRRLQSMRKTDEKVP